MSAGIASRWLRDRQEEFGRVMKIVQTDNIAAHYRVPIYVKIVGSEGSREREDLMSEVEDNIRPGLGDGWAQGAGEAGWQRRECAYRD